MPLLGPAAMLLSFDVADDAIVEHDDWHTHEHLPERLAIPGFLRGSRWTATQPGVPRYMVIYEVAQLATLTSAPYLERLNHPSAWTSKMMPHYRGMTRGLCAVRASAGLGLGSSALLLRYTPAAGAADGIRAWLGERFAGLAMQPGLSSAHLLEGAATAAMTAEQRIRGADAGVDGAVVVMGYQREAVDELAARGTLTQELAARGAAVTLAARYGLAHSLSASEIA